MDSRYVEVNDAFQRMWGYDREEAVGRSVLDLGLWPRVEQWEYVGRLFANQGRIRDLDPPFVQKQVMNVPPSCRRSPWK